jgi:hypothetical protein
MRAMLGWIVLVLGNAGSAAGQSGNWRIGLTAGASVYTGATQGTGPDGQPLSFIPYRPAMWGAALAYGKEGVRASIAVRYGQPGLGIRGVPFEGSGATSSGVLVVAENAYKLSVFTAGLSTRLVRLRGGPSLRPSLGIELERWYAEGSAPRVILGGHAGLALEVDISRKLIGAVEAELGHTPASPFRREDVPEEFRTRSAWRRTLLASLAWRF